MMAGATTVKLVISSRISLVDLVHAASEKMAEVAGFEPDDALNVGLGDLAFPGGSPVPGIRGLHERPAEFSHAKASELMIGFVFGFALFHAGFTDSRRIAWAFYFKDVGVPVVMFSAIVTGMLGLWGLSLIGVVDISKIYMLPTFLLPMAVGGLIFGVGMVIGGYCPGTAAAAIATGKLDGIVFIVGFLIGFRFHAGLLPALGTIALAVAIGYSFSWVLATIGLAAKTPEAAQAAHWAR